MRCKYQQLIRDMIAREQATGLHLAGARSTERDAAALGARACAVRLEGVRLAFYTIKEPRIAQEAHKAMKAIKDRLRACQGVPA
jgi:hypothetical protein